MKFVTIYTDGACSGNPGPGGWAAILEYNGFEKEISGGDSATTNNRMELIAVISALEALKEPCAAEVYTDSAYIFNAFNNGWIYNWLKHDWHTAAKKPVENKELWQRLLILMKIHDVHINKVKGHSDDAKNNRCDVLARMAIKEIEKHD